MSGERRTSKFNLGKVVIGLGTVSMRMARREADLIACSVYRSTGKLPPSVRRGSRTVATRNWASCGHAYVNHTKGVFFGKRIYMRA